MDRVRTKAGALAGVALCAIAMPARAQMVAPAPARQTVDANGVDLFLGKLSLTSPKISMGNGEQGLSYFFVNTGSGWTDNIAAALDQNGNVVTVRIGASTDDFTVSGSSYISRQGVGATLTKSGTTYTYVATDGTVTHFTATRANGTPYYASLGRATDIVRPSGTKMVYSYDQAPYCSRSKPGSTEEICLQHTTAYRLSSVTNSYGYALSFRYESDELDDSVEMMGAGLGPWSNVIGMALNNVQRGGDTYSLGSSYSANGFTVNSPEGQTIYRSSGINVVGITRAGSSTENVIYGYAGDRVSSATTVAGTWSYGASDSGGQRTVTVTDPSNATTTYVFDISSARMRSMTDAANNTSRWDYDALGRLTLATAPEQNSVQYTRDARGNVTSTTLHAKPGSGQPDISTSAGYDGSCSNPLTCNQPSWTRDAVGAQTDYSYDPTHGGVTSVTMPADANGVRPQVRTTYSSFADQFGGTIYLPTTTSTCRTQSTCAGGPDEMVTEISYGSLSGNNLLPVSVIKRAGDNSVRTSASVTYDVVGNVNYATDALGAVSQFQYDGARRRTLVEGPDPDGGGSLQFRAVRTTYNGDDSVARVEVGTANQWGTGFSALQQVDSQYDPTGRKTREWVRVGGAVVSRTQFAYDASARLACAVVRMDPSQGDGQPDACVPQTSGSNGPDRVTRTVYNAVGRPQDVTSGYGTPEASTEHQDYTANGQVASVTDGNGNVTRYVWDAYDRQQEVHFQVPGQPGVTSSTDYEGVIRDANGNVTLKRLRDGQTISYGYDALGRLTSKDRPNAQYWETNQSYGYDLLGNLTSASDSNGHSLTFGYDALGRRTSQGDNWYWYGNASSVYDAAGRRTRQNWVDGFYVTYEYDAAGEMTAIRENGGFQLAGFGYDDLGRRTSLTRGNGVTTSYGYTGTSPWLQTLSHDLAGTGADLTLGFGYNPAGQIASRTSNNDGYAWTGAVNTDRGYGVNGLNQYTSAGTVGFGYDGRGNLNNSGGQTYAYTSDNQLAAGPGAALAYDALGRLFNGSALRAGDPNTTFTYDDEKISTEISQDTGGLLRRYVYGPNADEPLVWYEGSGTGDRRWLTADERGSIIGVTDGGGNVIDVNAYDEYGIPSQTSPANAGRFGYTGQAWIPQLGMWSYKARTYSPTLGRFMQTDPIGYGDGLNWYNYVGGDPINTIDPSGLLHYEARGVNVHDGNGNVVAAYLYYVLVPDPGDFDKPGPVGGQTMSGGGAGGKGRSPAPAPQKTQPAKPSTLQCVGSALWNNKGVLALDALSVAASFVPGGKGLVTAGAAVVGSYTGAAAIGIGVANRDVPGAAIGAAGHYVSTGAALLEGAKGLAGNLPVAGQALAIGGAAYDTYNALKEGGCLGGKE